jgi:O-antigen ligase
LARSAEPVPPREPRRTIVRRRSAGQVGPLRSSAQYAGPVAAAGLAVALAAGNLDRGGFTGASQNLLLLCVAVVLLVLLVLAPQALGAGARTVLVGCLVALAAVAMLSAVWTTGPASGAFREGLVAVALATTAIAGHAVVSEWGAPPLALALGVLALVEAVLGLGAAALRETPSALLLNGSWRPAGTYEYPPALGLLQVMALPVAFGLLGSRARGLVALGVVLLVLAGAVLGSADSRFDLALALATLVAIAAMAPPELDGSRTVPTGAIVLVAGIIAGALLIGRRTGPAGAESGLLGLTGLAIVSAALAAAWPMLLRGAARVTRRQLIGVAVLGAGAAAVAWIALGYTSTLTSTGGGLGHGRIGYWTAAFDAWKRRPLLGWGAGTFFAASIQYQAINDGTIFAHNLPLELAVELGVPGLLAGVTLYLAAARLLIRTRHAPGAWLLAPAVGCFLVDNLVDWTWHLAGLTALWAACAGGLAALARPDLGAANRSTWFAVAAGAGAKPFETVPDVGERP